MRSWPPRIDRTIKGRRGNGARYSGVVCADTQFAPETEVASKRKVTARSSVTRKNGKVSPSAKSSTKTSDWVRSLYESQTGKTIVAEMLVAAAGAAAAVLLSERGRSGAKALVQSGRDAASKVRRTGARAGSAATDVLGTAVERAGMATDAAAKTVGLKSEPTQQDLAEKALEMRNEGDAAHPSRPAQVRPRAPSREH